MENRIKNFIQKEELCNSNDRILVTLSGGVDSVVLLHLLHKHNFQIIVAHCNFALRGESSDADEQFVKSIAEKYKVQYFAKTFDTTGYAKSNKLSIEMAARELRYQWFYQLLFDENIDYIATGHHFNDSIETVFLNLTRGTGINGLSGIKSKNNKVIRPLLFASREQIETYAKENQLNYRYDASNDSFKYMRNIVRHQVIPALRKINPSFESTMLRNLTHVEQTAAFFNDSINVIRKDLLFENNDSVYIDSKKLLENKHSQIILFELLSKFNFNQSTVNDIYNGLPNSIGNIYFSNSHQLLIDRNRLIIEEIEETPTKPLSIKSYNDLKTVFNKAKLLDIKDFHLIKDNKVACLDYDSLQFPLIINQWENGDIFYPLGMSRKKKISDFLINEKVARFDKKRVQLLTSENEVVWVINYRIDNRFKVTSTTKKVLIIYS